MRIIAAFTIIIGMLLGTTALSAVPPKKSAPTIRTITITISTRTDEATLKSHLKPGDPLRVEAMALLGLKAFRQDHPEQAKAYFENTLRYLSEASNPKLDQVIALIGLGVLDMQENTDYTGGKQKLDQALQVAQGIDARNRPVIADLYLTYSALLFQTGHVDDAKKMIDKAVAWDTACTPCQELQKEMQAFANSPDYFAEMLQQDTLMRWNDETHVISIFLAPGVGLKDWTPQYAEMAKTAFSAWQTATGGRFEFRFVNHPDAADVRLRWLEPAIPSKSGDGSSTGHHIPAFLDNDIVSSDIEISLHDETGKPISKDETYSSLLHEIGHMLGLGHSPNPADVMSSSSVANVITARDIATLEKAYQTKPTYTNPLGMTLAQFRNQNP